jgi:hypothetical protein
VLNIIQPILVQTDGVAIVIHPDEDLPARGVGERTNCLADVVEIPYQFLKLQILSFLATINVHRYRYRDQSHILIISDFLFIYYLLIDLQKVAYFKRLPEKSNKRPSFAFPWSK